LGWAGNKKRGWHGGQPLSQGTSRCYCFTGAAEAFLDELAVFAVVDLVDFLAFLVVLVVEVCGVAGALEGGALCANIAAADNIVIKIVRFIISFSFLRGAFDLPLQIHLAAICLLEH
jgi:hypothetical protein